MRKLLWLILLLPVTSIFAFNANYSVASGVGHLIFQSPSDAQIFYTQVKQNDGKKNITQFFSIKNVGSGTITNMSVTFSATGFSFKNPPTSCFKKNTLSPGQSCTVDFGKITTPVGYYKVTARGKNTEQASLNLQVVS